MTSLSHPLQSRPESLIGAFRRFGPTGPVYEVLAIAPSIAPAEPMMRIRVLVSREEVDYRLSDILADPEG